MVVAVVSVTKPKKITEYNTVQNDKHEEYGGIVPEIAARSHFEHIHAIMRQAVNEARSVLINSDGIADCRTGLIGGVIVGLMAGKAASLTQTPLWRSIIWRATLTVRLLRCLFSIFVIIGVAGIQLLIVRGVGKYSLLGSTLDDAAGEAFDKVAKMIGFYPGAES